MSQIDQLIDVLKQVEKKYTQLLPLLDSELEAVIAVDIKALTSAVLEKERLISGIRQLDQKRIALLTQLSVQFNFCPDSVTLSALAQKVSYEHGIELNTLKGSITKLIQRVQQSNKQMRMLIRHCLRLVEQASSFFYHWAQVSSVYGVSGNINSANTGGRLVTNTA
ncbi:MAG: flagellar protein FlgN [Desulfobacteraceae bacterium]|nr:flagellar protein FlgN [Desulfobacteraceae bacterium]